MNELRNDADLCPTCISSRSNVVVCPAIDVEGRLMLQHWDRAPDEPTVFLVDDDSAALSSLVLLMRSMGLRSESFSTVDDFLQARLENRRGCVISDVRMLERTGLELLITLRTSFPELPVILVSAYADVEMAVRAMGDGAVTLLRKPCREQELWDAVQQALRLNSERRERKQARRELELRLQTLTEREIEILKRVTDGLPNKQIAKELDWSLRTIEKCRRDGLTKLGVKSPYELMKRFMTAGIDPFPGHEEGENASLPAN